MKCCIARGNSPRSIGVSYSNHFPSDTTHLSQDGLKVLAVTVLIVIISKSHHHSHIGDIGDIGAWRVT